MSNISLEQILDLVERQFNEVAVALVDGNPDRVQTSSVVLQKLVVQLIQAADATGRATLKQQHLLQRVKALADRAPQLRNAVHRRALTVDRALNILMPAAARSTYANDKGLGGAGGTYGSGPRQVGIVRYLAA
jgi:hypothetical protein